MKSIQSNTHSFVVKVWREETGGPPSEVVWRGQIIHVPSGQRRSFTELAEIPTFVSPYLQQLGVKLTWWRRVRQWLGGKVDRLLI